MKMKFQLFALVLVVAGTCAMTTASHDVVVDSLNQPAPGSIVEDIIKQVIKLISDGIKKVGLDPFEIKQFEFIFPKKHFPVKVKGHIENLKFDGASNININSLDYNSNKLQFNISVPQLNFNVGDSGIEVSVFNKNFDSQFKGSLITEAIGLSGEGSVTISSINHVHLDSINLNFGVGNIKSNLSVSAFGIDFSKSVNNIFNNIVPNLLKHFGPVINKFLEGIVKGVFFLINLFF